MGRRPYSRFPVQGRSVSRPLWSPPEKSIATATSSPSSSSIPSCSPLQRNASLCVCALVVPPLEENHFKPVLFGGIRPQPTPFEGLGSRHFVLFLLRYTITLQTTRTRGPVSVILSYSTLGASKLHFIHERHDQSIPRTQHLDVLQSPDTRNATTHKNICFYLDREVHNQAGPKTQSCNSPLINKFVKIEFSHRNIKSNTYVPPDKDKHDFEQPHETDETRRIQFAAKGHPTAARSRERGNILMLF